MVYIHAEDETDVAKDSLSSAALDRLPMTSDPEKTYDMAKPPQTSAWIVTESIPASQKGNSEDHDEDTKCDLANAVDTSQNELLQERGQH